MREKIITKRIESLDLLKGLVMVFMALDHTRDYFHNTAYLFSATEPENTYTALFITRWISHLCAPAFCFLAGTSAFLVGRRKSKKELSVFLLKRGIWLVFIEIAIINFGWFFNIEYPQITLQVIWSLGISMILLSALIHLPMRMILLFSLVIIFGHNLLDYIDIRQNIFWSFLHQVESFPLGQNRNITIVYPIIPWIGVMSLGYYIGQFYQKEITSQTRTKLLNILGITAIILFITIRSFNAYGNPNSWITYENWLPSFFDFMDPSKYPPSLTYLLMTLGPALLFLANSEKLKGKVVAFFTVFGRVPFFYYIIHIYLIHVMALLFSELTGFGWEKLIAEGRLKGVFFDLNSQGYGVDLWLVYIIWAVIIIILYPLCKRFGEYKKDHKEKWWLSYL
jgi:uncharacterized membrane protein